MVHFGKLGGSGGPLSNSSRIFLLVKGTKACSLTPNYVKIFSLVWFQFGPKLCSSSGPNSPLFGDQML